ncbi:MAG: methyltransferase domain-containing protein [Polyangiaceae bacterium]|nr:methyltransferase domain-containing protein [Polyangiaceae bacterium]
MRIIRVDSNPPTDDAADARAPFGPPAPDEHARDEGRNVTAPPGLESRDVRDSDVWPASVPPAATPDASDEARTPLRPPRPSLPSDAPASPSVSREQTPLDLLGQLSIDDEALTPPWPEATAWDDEAATAPGGRTARRAEAEPAAPEARAPLPPQGERSSPRPSPPPASPQGPQPASLAPEVTARWEAADDDDFDIRETTGDAGNPTTAVASAEAPSPETRPASPVALARPAKPDSPASAAAPAGGLAPGPPSATTHTAEPAPNVPSSDASSTTTPAAEEGAFERRGRPPPPRARVAGVAVPESTSDAAQASEPVRSRPPVPPRARQRLAPSAEPAQAPAGREAGLPVEETSAPAAASAAPTAEPVAPSVRPEREAKPAPRASRPAAPEKTKAALRAEPVLSGGAAPTVAKAPEITYEELTPESDRSAEEAPKSLKRPPPPKRAARRQAEPAAPEAARSEAPRPEEKAPETPSFVKSDGQKRLRRPWWEDVFSEDFIRAERRLTAQEVARECDFILQSLGIQPGGVVLDVACGSGAHAVELASRGFSVVGFDLSLYQLALAGEHAQDRRQRINFLQGDVREMGFESMFDAVLCWNTSFGYFEEEKNFAVAERVFHALRPEGTLLLDVANRDYVSARQPSQTWFNGDACVCMDDTNIDYITSRLRVKRSIILDDGRTRECNYSIRLYSLHELGKLLHDVGFSIIEVSGHPATRGAFFGETSPRLIVLAQRP